MLEHLIIQQRFRLLLVVSLACFALCGVIVQRTLAEIRVNGPIYDRIMQGQDLVADILPPPAYLVESYLLALQLADADAGQARALLQRLQAARQAYEQRYRYWQGQGLSGELEDKFLRQSHALAQSFYATAFDQLAPAVQAGEVQQAQRALARLGPVYEQQRQVIEQVVDLARRRNADDERAALERVRTMAWSLGLMFMLIVGVFVLSDDLRTFRGKMRDGLRRSVLDEFLQSVEVGADIATRSLQRAADLMSSFKQVAADRASSQRRRFLLHQVVHETQMTLQPMLKRANCQVTLDVPPALQLDSFPGPLGQVIANLIENAARHGLDDGGGVIALRARAAGAGMVTISVSDHGKGIAPELHSHVFEPFYTTRLGQAAAGWGCILPTTSSTKSWAARWSSAVRWARARVST